MRPAAFGLTSPPAIPVLFWVHAQAFTTEDTVFGFTEVKLGLVPAVISPFVVDKIGTSAASRYFLTGETFSASEALRIGLVHGVAPSLEELDATIMVR